MNKAKELNNKITIGKTTQIPLKIVKAKKRIFTHIIIRSET